MSGNEEIKKAWDELQRVSGDETLERIAELRLKGAMDEMAARAYAEEERKKRTEEKNGKIEIAQNMLKKKMDINLIAELTGLTIKELQELQK